MKSKKHLAQGLTLIEVMIAMVMGIMFLTSVIQIIIINSQSFRVRNSVSRLQEDGRLVMELMSRELRHTGYRVYPYTDTLENLFEDRPNAFNTADDVPETSAIFGLTSNPDSIIIRYQIESIDDLAGSLCAGNLSPGLTDAQYRTPGMNAVVTEKFFVDAGHLKCDARLDYNAAGSPKTANALALISHVENLRILYGIDTNASADNIPNQYVDAANIPDNNGDTFVDWERVNAIRISLILKSNKTNLTRTDTTTPMTINGGFDVAISTPGERRLYRVFSTTIMLRNMALWEL